MDQEEEKPEAARPVKPLVLALAFWEGEPLPSEEKVGALMKENVLWRKERSWSSGGDIFASPVVREETVSEFVV